MKKVLILLLLVPSGTCVAAQADTIHGAVTAGDLEAVKGLISENPIEASQQVNQATGNWQLTPLHIAAINGNKEAASFL